MPADVPAGLLLVVAVGVAWFLPVVLGVREAKRKGLSPNWMWFGVHPLGGWIAYAFIHHWGHYATTCPSCGKQCDIAAETCPDCGAQLPVQEEQRFRWAQGQMRCQRCRRFVPMNDEHCPSCGEGMPRLVCPSCGGTDTRVVSSTALVLVASVALFAGAALFCPLLEHTYMEAGGLTWEGSVCISMMVLCLVMALVGIMLAPSHRTKAVSCAACGKRQRIPSGTPPLAEGVSTTSLATHRAEGASREQPDEVPPVAATPSPPAKTTEPGHQCAECGRPVVLYEQTLTDLAGMGVTKQRVGLEVERHRLVAVGSAHDIYWFLSQHSPSEAEVFREVWAGHAYACPQCRRLLCAECAGAMPGDDPEWVPVGTGRCPRCGTPFEGTTLTEWPEWAE